MPRHVAITKIIAGPDIAFVDGQSHAAKAKRLPAPKPVVMLLRESQQPQKSAQFDLREVLNVQAKREDFAGLHPAKDRPILVVTLLFRVDSRPSVLLVPGLALRLSAVFCGVFPVSTRKVMLVRVDFTTAQSFVL